MLLLLLGFGGFVLFLVRLLTVEASQGLCSGPLFSLPTASRSPVATKAVAANKAASWPGLLAVTGLSFVARLSVLSLGAGGGLWGPQGPSGSSA